MFRAPKVPELRVRETEKSTLESETKILDHYSIQTYPQLVGNMASGATFCQVMNICLERTLLGSSGMIWDDLGTFWSDLRMQIHSWTEYPKSRTSFVCSVVTQLER